MEEKLPFYKTEVGKIVSHVVHDTNHTLGTIRWYITCIVENKKTSAFTTPEEGLVKIKEKLKEISNLTDYLYTKIKALEESKAS